MTELKSLKFFPETRDPLIPPVPEPVNERFVDLLLAGESDAGRGTVLTGMILMMFGLLLANFGALNVLTAHSAEKLAGQPLLRLVPVLADPQWRWALFGLTSLVMAGGMVLIGSQRLHSSLLIMHVLVPLSFIPLVAGWLIRGTIRMQPMAVQLWAGAATFLSAWTMVTLVGAVSRHESQTWIMILAFAFQAGLALLTGSLLVFGGQIRGARDESA